MKIAHGAVLFFFMVMVYSAKMLCCLLKLMVVGMPIALMAMAKVMKRLEARGKQYHGHQRQVKYGKFSFHSSKGREKY